jgi:hypothetical protein
MSMQLSRQTASLLAFESSVELQKCVIKVLRRRGEATAQAEEFLERLQAALELSKRRVEH